MIVRIMTGMIDMIVEGGYSLISRRAWGYITVNVMM
jgi:hypothetical protein